MNKDAIKDQLLNLESEIQALIKQVDKASSPVVLDQNSVGRLSRMDAMQGQAMALASSERQKQMLSKVHDALARVDSEDFGRCHECDEFIPEGRLQLDPTHTYCVACAQALE